jgi:hypothetical protein
MSHICGRCGTVGKPKTARRAWGMFVVSVLLSWWALLAGPVERELIASAIFFAALFSPNVCGACQSSELLPVGTPRAKQLLAIVESQTAAKAA